MVSASEILEERVADTTFNEVFRQGFRGVLYSIFLYAITIVTGFVDIVANFFEAAANGVGGAFGAFLNGIATIIRFGAISTATNLIELGPTGFLEALLLTFAALFIMQQALEFFDTDIFVLPGFALIPFFGEEVEETDDS